MRTKGFGASGAWNCSFFFDESTVQHEAPFPQTHKQCRVGCGCCRCWFFLLFFFSLGFSFFRSCDVLFLLLSVALLPSLLSRKFSAGHSTQANGSRQRTDVRESCATMWSESVAVIVLSSAPVDPTTHRQQTESSHSHHGGSVNVSGRPARHGTTGRMSPAAAQLSDAAWSQPSRTRIEHFVRGFPCSR